MDCRAMLGVALGFLSVAGCQHSSLLTPSKGQPVVQSALPEGALVKKEEDLPPHAPTTRSLVAAGDMFSGEAEAKDRPTLNRQELREKARRAYQQAIKLDGKCLVAYQGLARLYVAMNDHDHAVSTLEKAIQIVPDNASLYFALGMCYSRQKEWESALSQMTRAVDLDPENRQYVNMLGYALARAGRYQDSLDCFTRVHDKATAHYNLARMLQHMNELELSRQHLQIALEMNPQLTDARSLLSEMTSTLAAPSPPVQVPQPIQPVVYPTLKPVPEETTPTAEGQSLVLPSPPAMNIRYQTATPAERKE